ncbi:MAG TPA: hypothetical protein VN901_13150 [Candidatus Acidoferrales bacterium]|nr:hypothetical protein [Candidatus Acidoferrales bacterium]
MSDAGPADAIWFEEDRRKYVDLFPKQDSSERSKRVLDSTTKGIDGFESPFGSGAFGDV